MRRRDCPRVYPTHTLFLRLRGGGTFIFDEKIIFFLRRRDRPRVYPTHTLFLRLRGGGTFIFDEKINFFCGGVTALVSTHTHTLPASPWWRYFYFFNDVPCPCCHELKKVNFGIFFFGHSFLVALRALRSRDCNVFFFFFLPPFLVALKAQRIS